MKIQVEINTFSVMSLAIRRAVTEKHRAALIAAKREEHYDNSADEACLAEIVQAQNLAARWEYITVEIDTDDESLTLLDSY